MQIIFFTIYLIFGVILRISFIFGCSLRQYNCQCSDWVEKDLKNVYIGCLEQDINIQPFDFNDLQISMSYDRIELHFENKNFVSLLNLKESDKIRRVRIRKSGIQRITNTTFIGLTNVELISLDLNQISLIEENSFFNCSSLNEINLSYNLIKNITSKTFSGADKLLFLWLSGNQIEFIEKNSFDNLKFLKKISLNNNQLTYILADFFKNLIDLEEIYAYSNKISKVEKYSFKYTKSLKRLWLMNNLINLIEENTFCCMELLPEFDLNENKLTKIQEYSFIGLKSLKKLILSKNKIKNIEQNVFSGNFEQLEQIWIDQNEIEFIHPKAFEKLNSLKILHLSVNYLKFVYIHNLENLEFLFIGKTSIESINKKTFTNLTILKSLTLSTNNISFIENRSFENMSHLEKIDLFDNKLELVNKESFYGIFNLNSLKLESNKLKIIYNHTFEYLTKLRELWLNDNEIEIIDSHGFHGLKELNFLYLGKNKIKHINKETFKGLIVLEKLILNNNLIENIEQDYFENNANLKELNFFDNKLGKAKLKFNLLSDVKIFLQSNYITHFELSNSVCGTNGKINEINLNKNLIQQLDESSFKDFSCLVYLKSLDISQNRILKIGEKTFVNLRNLVFLNLSQNWLNLESHTFRDLVGIETLDLSFNDIKFLNDKQFENCPKLTNLILKENQIKEICLDCLSNLNSLEYLNFEKNLIKKIEKNSFTYLVQLKELNLRSNKITSMSEIIESSTENKLNNLKILDLSNNLIVSFDFLSLKVKFQYVEIINLNENMLRNFSNILINNITTIKLSKTRADQFRFYFWSEYSNERITHLKELDLSFNNILFESIEKMVLENLERLNLRSTGLKTISTIQHLINENLIGLDLSDNEIFSNESSKEFFRSLKRLETLELKNVSLDDLNKIYFNNKLTVIDLSFNKLSILGQKYFENLKYLKYLDLSFNNISHVENGTFDSNEGLEYLNLENNAIRFISENSFLDYNNLTSLKISFNNLRKVPCLDFTDEKNLMNKLSNLKEIYLNNNKIISFSRTMVIPFSKMVTKITLDYNEINQIEKEAFLNLKLLENLSLSNNLLKKLQKDDFQTLFNLKYLNLSFNFIEIIEIGTFKDLEKLLVLDLNFNSLKNIPIKLFSGLTQLNDLYLISKTEIELNNQSFIELTNTLKNIYLNDSLIRKYLCLTKKLFERNKIEKLINRSYGMILYFRSLNLLTETYYSTKEDDHYRKVFHFLQFNIHLNLKEDFQNENLFQYFSKTMIKESSIFYRQNLKKCSNQTFSDFIIDKEKINSTFSSDIIFIILTILFIFIIFAVILMVVIENLSSTCY